MQDLRGKVAVVTGGASGIGLAMGARFASEGMHVVLADVEEPALDAVVEGLRGDGLDVGGVPTDVTDYGSVSSLAASVLEQHGAVHVVCLNAGVGSGAEGAMWEYGLTDWGWATAVNLWGVIHGIKAFVPHLVTSPDDGHVVITSSGNGGVSPLPLTPIYAMTKAAVVTIAECLYAQLARSAPHVKASVLFPGPHMLRTGLWTSQRNRPADFAPERPRTTPPRSLDDYDAAMRAAGVEPQYTDPADVAAMVVDAIAAERFWILPESERTDAAINARAAAMLARRDPDYFPDFVLDT
jgi:NAD(P)-dependent dehydrogenase (short-subunit alcohol dehydrogenase family)